MHNVFMRIIRSRRAGLVLAMALLGGTAGQAQDRWEGFYGGLSLDSVGTASDVGSNPTHKHSRDEESLGLFFGRNYVRGGGFVWGPEVLLHGAPSGGRKTDAALGSSELEGSFVLTPRVRAGWANDRVFVYGALGLSISDVTAQPVGDDGTDIFVAPSFGIGAEMAINEQWSGRLDASITGHDADQFRFNGAARNVDSGIGRVSFGLARKF